LVSVLQCGPPCRLDDSGAQDVVQETVIAVARKMPGVRYDPQRGSFKQWPLRITHRRIADHPRQVYRQPVRADIDPALLEQARGKSALDWEFKARPTPLLSLNQAGLPPCSALTVSSGKKR
jgi:DNA-directed RNA polymerase specialized sigma24 family protein